MLDTDTYRVGQNIQRWRVFFFLLKNDLDIADDFCPENIWTFRTLTYYMIAVSMCL